MPKQFQIGDIVYVPNYCKIWAHGVSTDGSPMYVVEDVFTHVQYTVRGQELIDTHESAYNYGTINYVNVSELVRTFLTCADGRVFTVGFIKVDGAFRVLRGKYVAEEPLFGRTKVVDFDANNEIRLVDHRTLQFVVCNGVLHISEKSTLHLDNIVNHLARSLK